MTAGERIGNCEHRNNCGVLFYPPPLAGRGSNSVWRHSRKTLFGGVVWGAIFRCRRTFKIPGGTPPPPKLAFASFDSPPQAAGGNEPYSPRSPNIVFPANAGISSRKARSFFSREAKKIIPFPYPLRHSRAGGNPKYRRQSRSVFAETLQIFGEFWGEMRFFSQLCGIFRNFFSFSSVFVAK